jgi:hypothetical protein
LKVLFIVVLHRSLKMKKLFGITLALIMLCSGLVVLPAMAAETGDDPAWTIHFRPAVRFGTDNRTLYIMDFMVPLYEGQKNLLFFNPRFTPNDVDGWETNLGLGYRHLLFDDRLILGANVYYDTRRTGWGTYHDQIGFGFEAMTEINRYVALTGRFNYYIPLTDPIVDGTLGGGYVFRDQGIYTLGGGTVEESLQGFDAELGFRVPFVSDYVETWVYGGGYHYSGDYIKDVDGWTARLEVIPTDFVRLNYEYKEDRTNHGEHYGEIMFEVPFSIGNLVAGKNPFMGFGTRFGGSRDMKTRLSEPVRRDVDITVKTERTEGAGSGAGELVEGVIFVSDDGSDTTGDGTYENPYHSIGYAVDNLGAYNIIHVMNRLGGTADAGTVDVWGVTVWGSGVAHPDYPGISNFTAGTYPAVSGVLALSGSDITVMGLYMQGGGTQAEWFGSAIEGITVRSNLGGIVIRDNRISLSGGGHLNGIRADACVSPGLVPILITRNVITVTENVGGNPSYAIGVVLANHASPHDTGITGTISDNEFAITSTGYWTQTFAACLDAETFPGSVGMASSHLYFIDNYGTITFEGAGTVTGMIWGAPNPTWAGVSYLDLGTGATGIGSNSFTFPNGTANSEGWNTRGYVFDRLSNPDLYTHP